MKFMKKSLTPNNEKHQREMKTLIVLTLMLAVLFMYLTGKGEQQ